MNGRAVDYGLEFLLAFNGRIHHLERGYWLKFEITLVGATPERPHGLSYSFTLHAPDGTRLAGFDNAHNVRGSGGAAGPAIIGIARRRTLEGRMRSKMPRR